MIQNQKKGNELKFILALIIGIIFSPLLFAQTDSVDVTFFYSPNSNPSTVYLPGEFNGWTYNSNSLMSKVPR